MRYGGIGAVGRGGRATSGEGDEETVGGVAMWRGRGDIMSRAIRFEGGREGGGGSEGVVAITG